MVTDDIDWANYRMPHDDVTLSDDGYYHCATCGDRLEAVREVDRSGDVPDAKWRCETCDASYWLSLRGPVYDGR